MAYEASNNAVQTINPGESAIFTNSYGNDRYIFHRDETGSFKIAAMGANRCSCRCCHKTTDYFVDFGGNIAIPTGGTVGPISLAISLDGSTVPATTMIANPAAVEEFSNVSVAKIVPIWNACCETISIRNISDQPILLQNANIVLNNGECGCRF